MKAKEIFTERQLTETMIPFTSRTLGFKDISPEEMREKMLDYLAFMNGQDRSDSLDKAASFLSFYSEEEEAKFNEFLKGSGMKIEKNLTKEKE